jgi:hypothetical protein
MSKRFLLFKTGLASPILRDPVGIDFADPCRLAPAILQSKKEP